MDPLRARPGLHTQEYLTRPTTVSTTSFILLGRPASSFNDLSDFHSNSITPMETTLNIIILVAYKSKISSVAQIFIIELRRLPN